MSRNTLEAGWLLRQMEAAQERASKLPSWLTKSTTNPNRPAEDRRDAEHRESERRDSIRKQD